MPAPKSHGRRRGRKGPGRGGRKADRATVEPLHPTLDPPAIESFHEWSLGDEVLGAIDAMGISVPTPIQRLTIQPILDGKDVIAKAETGTGKTLAFGAPMMSRIDAGRVSVLGLVLCPTRELAEQVCSVLTELGEPRAVQVALIVGGEEMGPQVEALQSGAQVVVGTPGRVLDLMNQRFLSFPWTEYVVLDEADEMLEIGFLDDVEKILSYTPEERQTLLFSATFPPDLLRLARRHTREPVEVATAKGLATVATISQEWMAVREDDRPLTLTRLIERSAEDDVFLVFCDRRTEVERLMRRLERLPFAIKALHGGYDQASRFRVMSAFREHDVKALIATDVASRGLDVKHVTHVVNYAVPRDVTAYTHRIGRTGRAGRDGHAITFVTPATERRWKGVLRQATWDVHEVEPPGSRSRRERPAEDARQDDRAERPRRRGAETRAGERRKGRDSGRGREESARSDDGGARENGARRLGRKKRDEKRSSRSATGGRRRREEETPSKPRTPEAGSPIDFGSGV